MTAPGDLDPQDDIEPFLRSLGAHLATASLTSVRDKSTLDPVSNLDLWAEQEVKRYLANHFPGDALFSEESASSVTYQDRIWVLDPLDGTVNRTSGIPFYAVSLALLEHGEPTLAYVVDPSHDELFVARRGEGATVNGRPLHVASEGVHGLALTSKLIRGLGARAPERLVDLLTRHGRVRNLGAQALQLSYVAAGRLSAAVSLGTRLWDNAAGALLVKEAGGLFTDLAGNDPFPVSPGHPTLSGAAMPCIAGSAVMHARLVELLTAAGL